MRRRFCLPNDMLMFLAVILFDQLIKIVVKLSMVPGESIPVVRDVFHLTFVLNPGAAFGIMENQRLFFVLAGTIVIAAAFCMYPTIRKMDRWMHYGVMALLGGAVGNLIDRIESGLVVDYLDFRFWPVFNLADIAIVIGVGSMLYSILFLGEGSQRKRRNIR